MSTSSISDYVSNMSRRNLNGGGKAIVRKKTKAEIDLLLDITKVVLAWGNKE